MIKNFHIIAWILLWFDALFIKLLRFYPLSFFKLVIIKEEMEDSTTISSDRMIS